MNSQISVTSSSDIIRQIILENPLVHRQIQSIYSDLKSLDEICPISLVKNLSESILSNCDCWLQMSLEHRFLIGKFLIDNRQSIDNRHNNNNSYYYFTHISSLIRKTNTIYDEFSDKIRCADRRSSIVVQLESSAYKSFTNLIDLLSIEARFYALKSIVYDRYRIFSYKYFRNVSVVDLLAIFNWNFRLVPSGDERNRFAFAFCDLMIDCDRLGLAKDVLRAIVSENGPIDEVAAARDDDECAVVIYRCVVRLLRMDSSVSIECACGNLGLDRERSETILRRLDRSGFTGAELRFKRDWRLAIGNDEIVGDIKRYLQELQSQKNQFCVYHMLKKICVYHQLATFSNDDFCIQLSLYFVRFTFKHFGQYSSFFVGALKMLIKMLISLNIPARTLTGQALGLCEMIYFSPSKNLSSLNLLYSKSIYHDFKISNSQLIKSEDYVLALEHAKKSYEFSLEVEGTDKIQIKSLLWLLQIIVIHEPNGKLSKDFQLYFNELCFRISKLQESNCHLFQLYRKQLELIDQLTVSIYQKNFGNLSDINRELLRSSVDRIDEKDSLIGRKMKIFCNCSPLVFYYHINLDSENGNRHLSFGNPSEIVYDKLLRNPDDRLFYEYRFWSLSPEKQATVQCSSETEDSESDSLSDSSTNSYCC